MSLITLSQYKSLTNTVGTDDDALITLLLTTATEQIEAYCNRTFAAADYIEWFAAENRCMLSYATDQYPINKVYYVGLPDWAIKIENGGTTQYTISIKDTTLSVTDESFTTNDYDLTDAANDTLTELASVLEAAYTDFTVTINSDAVQASKLMREQKAYVVPVGSSIELIGAARGAQDVSISSDTLYGINHGLIYYNAGYSTIPNDLQLACANIVRDSLQAQKGEIDGKYKSQNITNYSYTLADVYDVNTIISGYIANYASTLNYYRKVVIGG